MGGAVRGDFQPSIWMNWAIISAGILKPPVGHLRGEQKKSESGNLKAETGKLNTGQWRLVVGDGAFAPEAWGRSASLPYPLFRFAGIRPIHGFFKTAEGCLCHKPSSLRLRVFV
jgi:hypothetical protein